MTTEKQLQALWSKNHKNAERVYDLFNGLIFWFSAICVLLSLYLPIFHQLIGRASFILFVCLFAFSNGILALKSTAVDHLTMFYCKGKTNKKK